MFVDKVRITVCGGRGGDGAVAFHREKYVAAGGPDGGDGGHGGSVILRVNDNMSTLLDFRYKRKYAAEAGVNGMGRKMAGKRGEPLIIQVPRGTVVRDAETNQIIVDMSTGEDFVIARGGRGGWGNAHYATATRQVPRFAKAGLKGQERDIILELKLLADVGLVGLPQRGKIHPALRHLQCPAQDRKLPLYHSIPQPGRHLCRRRRFLCHGRHPRYH